MLQPAADRALSVRRTVHRQSATLVAGAFRERLGRRGRAGERCRGLIMLWRAPEQSSCRLRVGRACRGAAAEQVAGHRVTGEQRSRFLGLRCIRKFVGKTGGSLSASASASAPFPVDAFFEVGEAAERTSSRGSAAAAAGAPKGGAPDGDAGAVGNPEARSAGSPPKRAAASVVASSLVKSALEDWLLSVDATEGGAGNDASGAEAASPPNNAEADVADVSSPFCSGDWYSRVLSASAGGGGGALSGWRKPGELAAAAGDVFGSASSAALAATSPSTPSTGLVPGTYAELTPGSRMSDSASGGVLMALESAESAWEARGVVPGSNAAIDHGPA